LYALEEALRKPNPFSADTEEESAQMSDLGGGRASNGGDRKKQKQKSSAGYSWRKNEDTVLRGELPARQATMNIPPTQPPNKEALQVTGTVAVDLSLAAQTTAFLQAEAEWLAAILAMSPAEQVLVHLLPV
jgi:hypothetical protein